MAKQPYYVISTSPLDMDASKQGRSQFYLGKLKESHGARSFTGKLAAIAILWINCKLQFQCEFDTHFYAIMYVQDTLVPKIKMCRTPLYVSSTITNALQARRKWKWDYLCLVATTPLVQL